MNRYQLMFQQNRRRLSQTVDAKNYDDAEQVAGRIIRGYRKRTGDSIELQDIERVYKGDTKDVKKTMKRKYGVADAIGNTLDFFAGIG